LEFLKFGGNLKRIKGVVSLSNVLRADGAMNQTFIRGFNGSSGLSQTLASTLENAFESLGWGIPTPTIVDFNGLPPSSLSSFAEKPFWAEGANTGGIVVTGFENDISEANPHFETDGDVMDPALFDTFVDRVETISTAIARTLFVSAGGSAATIDVDRSLIASLLSCFGEADFAKNCDLAYSALGVSTSSQMNTLLEDASPSANHPFLGALNNPLPSYTSVYIPLAVTTGQLKFRELLIRNLLANLTLGGAIPVVNANDDSSFSCSSDVDCRDSWSGVALCPGPLASNASVACIAGGCVCTTVFLQDAWSPSLAFNPDTGAFSINPNNTIDSLVYTEPFWTDENFASFAVSSTTDIAASLFVGILMTVATFFLLHIWKKKEGGLGKFKLS